MAGIEKSLSTVKKKSVAPPPGRKFETSIWSPGDGPGVERIEEGVRQNLEKINISGEQIALSNKKVLLKRFEEDLGPRTDLIPSMSRSLSEKDVLAEQQKTETIREELAALGIA